MSFPNSAGRGGGALPTCHPTAPPGSGSPRLRWGPPLSAGTRNSWEKTPKSLRGELGALAHPGGLGPFPLLRAPRDQWDVCSRHCLLPVTASGMDVQDESAGWIPHPAHPWRGQLGVNHGVTPPMSHGPVPALVSWEQEPPWIPGGLSCCGLDPSRGEWIRFPPPWDPPGAAESECGSWICHPWFRSAFGCSSCACIRPHPHPVPSGRGWAGSGTPGSRECSILPGILAVDTDCCFPGNRP